MSDIFGNAFGMLGNIAAATSNAQMMQSRAQENANAQYNQYLNNALQNAAYGHPSAMQQMAMMNASPFPKPTPTVSQTAASRVKASDWERQQDRKDAEVDAWLQAVYDQGADGD